MLAYDKTFDPEVVLGHCDLVSRFSDFALHLDTQLEYFQTFLARLHEVHRAIAVTSVVHVPVPVPVRVPVRVRVTLALKFSRSPYLDNHSS